MSSLPEVKQSHIATLDLLRLVAALAVVAFHYLFRGAAAGGYLAEGYPEAAPFAIYGYLGVNLFFLISGFVIAWSAQGRSWESFAVARFAQALSGLRHLDDHNLPGHDARGVAALPGVAQTIRSEFPDVCPGARAGVHGRRLLVDRAGDHLLRLGGRSNPRRRLRPLPAGAGRRLAGPLGSQRVRARQRRHAALVRHRIRAAVCRRHARPAHPFAGPLAAGADAPCRRLCRCRPPT